MKNELAYWFAEGKPYKAGVKIFTALIGDTLRVRFFNSGAGKMQQKMLYKELLRYARIHNIAPRKRPVVQKKTTPKQKPKQNSAKHQPTKKHIKVNRSEIHYDDLPRHLQQKYDQNSSIWSRIQLLHAKMQALPASEAHNEARKKYLNEIIDLDKARRKNWENIDKMKIVEETIKPTGRLTLDEINTIEDKATRALAIDKRIETNLMYIRRYHGSKTPRQMAQVALRIEELKKLNVDYETRIKRDIHNQK